MTDSVPCKFYARGFCRYGNSCRFYHGTQNQGSYYTTSNPQESFYTPQNQSVFGRSSTSSIFPSNINQGVGAGEIGNDPLHKIMQNLISEMEEWEQSNIWPFSSFGPFGGRPSLPGTEGFDLSNDEIRYAYIMNGNTFPPELQLNERLDQLGKLRNNYMQHNTQNILLLKTLLELPQLPDVPFTISNSTINFLNQSQSQPTGTGTQSFFGGTSTSNIHFTQSTTFGSTNPNNIFGGSESASLVPGSALSTFNFTTSPNFMSSKGQNLDLTNNQTTDLQPFSFTPFSSSTTNIIQNQSISHPQPQLPWINSISTQKQQLNFLPGIGGNIGGAEIQDNLTYSLREELNDEEMNGYQSDEFIDFVPINPPPKTLCS